MKWITNKTGLKKGKSVCDYCIDSAFVVNDLIKQFCSWFCFDGFACEAFMYYHIWCFVFVCHFDRRCVYSIFNFDSQTVICIFTIQIQSCTIISIGFHLKNTNRTESLWKKFVWAFFSVFRRILRIQIHK